MLENSKYLRKILDTAIDGVIVIDQNGVIVDLNIATCNLFGYEKHELLGAKVNNLMPKYHAARHDDYLDNYNVTREKKIIGIGREVYARSKGGVQFPIRLAVSEMKVLDKTYFIGIVHDMTEVRRAHNRVIKLNEELEKKVDNRTEDLGRAVNKLIDSNKKLKSEVIERKNVELALKKSERDLVSLLEKEKAVGELKSKFVSLVSHEFRTPLSTILSSISIVDKYAALSNQYSKIEKHIFKIKKSVRHLNGILQDLLTLGKLEDGTYTKVTKEKFIIQDICNEVVEDVENQLKDGQSIKIVSPKKEVNVFLEKRYLKNILYNLITNAIKYSHENQEILIKIDVNERVKLSICDKGIGIPKDDQFNLFRRFYRAGNVSNIQGTGLGLNIVQKCIKLIQGEVKFESKENEGSKFYIYLPIFEENK